MTHTQVFEVKKIGNVFLGLKVTINRWEKTEVLGGKPSNYIKNYIKNL